MKSITSPQLRKRRAGICFLAAREINQRWRNLDCDNVTGKGWVVRDGILIKKQGVPAGNLIMRRTWTNFEFAWEWKLGTKGNNGVKYMVL